jgi:cullin-associated NEDD8-dissociated protein 1
VASRYAPKDPSSPLALLQSDSPSLIKASARQLSDKSLKTRSGMFGVLHTLLGVLPSSIAEHVGVLVPGG